MITFPKPLKHFYSETEAAHYLRISLPALHEILDAHVFNAAHPRPEKMEFTHGELLLLSIWAEPGQEQDHAESNLVMMPSRR